MSFETRKQQARKVLSRWGRSNQSPAAQDRLIGDRDRLWRLARDLAFALDNLLAHAGSHSDRCSRRDGAAEIEDHVAVDGRQGRQR